MIESLLLPWFAANQRAMPWRQTKDPYAIWVSEIMLAQTRVQTVTPYYERFLHRFPTLRALAAADQQDVIKAWEGLGYYARARNLHRAAQTLVEAGRAVPDTMAGLLALPGVGRYTAGAILSIAFGQAVPVLDGNVRRVLCRLYADEGESDERLWERAAALVSLKDPSAHNQAMMELGATVCTAAVPRCMICPLAEICEARKQGRADQLPRRAPPKVQPQVEEVAAVIAEAGRILIARRPPKGLLGGLWEVPGGRPAPQEPLPRACERHARERVGVEIEVSRQLGTVQHTFTHFKLTLQVYLCGFVAGVPRAIGYDEVCWMRSEDASDYTFSTSQHRVLALLNDNQLPF